MTHNTHTARVTEPLVCVSTSGERVNIPPGPCIVEEQGDTFDIIWGAQGEESAELSAKDVEEAEESGFLVLLD